MNITGTLYIVRLPQQGWTKAERELYDGRLVLADLDGRPDHTGAVSVLFLEGPLDGQEAWLKPDLLEPWVSEPNTSEDW